MAAFIKSGLTGDGARLLSKGLIGKTITFMRIVLGNGYLPDSMGGEDVTSVISPVVSLPISDIRMTDGGEVVLSAVFHPSMLETEFYYREFGVYALDPDTGGEILYCYGNSGDEAEHILPNGSQSLVEKIIDVIIKVGNAKNITAYIPSGACATVAQYNTYLTQVNNIMNSVTIIMQDAQDAIDAANEAKQAFLDLIPLLRDLESKVNTIYDALLSKLTENPFTLTFGTLDDVQLVSGIWNEPMARLEC